MIDEQNITTIFDAPGEDEQPSDDNIIGSKYREDDE